MTLSPQILDQARASLVEYAQQNIQLIGAVREQGRKITELEREVQKQATGRALAEQQLAAARMEIEALRPQIPSDATINAYQALTQFLSAPAEVHPELRMAA